MSGPSAPAVAAGAAADGALASLSMYGGAAAIDAAHDALWAGIRDRLRAAGLTRVPDALDRSRAPAAAWRHPCLLLAQSCGMPLVGSLAGLVRLVAAPVYGFPGGAEVPQGAVARVVEGDAGGIPVLDAATAVGGPGDGPPDAAADGVAGAGWRRSLLVVGRNAVARDIADLRGGRAAVNEAESNSGANLLRAAVAPFAREGRFFSGLVFTGGHRASLAAVGAGEAEVAAIDSVTFALARRFEPDLTAAVRPLAWTPATPWLPYVTRADLAEEEVVLLRRALAAAFADPALAAARAVLGITGLIFPARTVYDRVLAVERAAAALGYPELG